MFKNLKKQIESTDVGRLQPSPVHHEMVHQPAISTRRQTEQSSAVINDGIANGIKQSSGAVTPMDEAARYDALLRTHSHHRQKTGEIIQKKDANIDRLKKRVTMLEQLLEETKARETTARASLLQTIGGLEMEIEAMKVQRQPQQPKEVSLLTEPNRQTPTLISNSSQTGLVQLADKETQHHHSSNGKRRDVATEMNSDISQMQSNSPRSETDVIEISHAASVERDALLLRNAALSQQLELERQQTTSRIDDLNVQLSRLQKLSDRNSRTVELESALADRDATIRLQQQRLSDMKKIMQRELRNVNNSNDGNRSPSHTSLLTPATAASEDKEGDSVNGEYLKHVVLRFVTASDTEAQQLVRAVAVLLGLDADEERRVTETLRWRRSSSAWISLFAKPS